MHFAGSREVRIQRPGNDNAGAATEEITKRAGLVPAFRYGRGTGFRSTCCPLSSRFRVRPPYSLRQ